jgi:hypothetical protein
MNTNKLRTKVYTAIVKQFPENMMFGSSLPYLYMTYHRGATSGAGTAYPSKAPEFTPVFSGVRVSRSFSVFH